MVRANNSRLNIQFLYTSIFTEWKKVVGFNLIDWRSDSAHYLLNYEPHFSLYLTNGGAYKTGYFLTSSSLYFFGAICDAGFLSHFLPAFQSKNLSIIRTCCEIAVNRFRWREIRLMVLSPKSGILTSSPLFGSEI